MNYDFDQAFRYYSARFSPSTIDRHWEKLVTALCARRRRLYATQN